ncbi:rhomboid family intramembrane serine protease [Streptomyces griseocarneus]|uniref:rhomboid family intramembrane serine protease n=1 Tax=Streptomyces griseocarneus TaxID=51201 RepID=UPI00167D5958|nr:rhomboid family intramembrane serine protease [Streptomyces griseocarneus]MBZ6472033.1 rhomboid family intramembrane serine protease [Streptomyces griseocarneus]GHG72136.1 rhomboid family intramembrane serine protease [Streptomyces griseocarneus]
MIRKAGHSRRTGTPWVSWTILGICGAVFLAGPASGLNPLYGTGTGLLSAQSAHFERWGVVPQELWHSSPLALTTPLTALFVHGNWLHLLGNMLFLFVFGAMTEARMGRADFALCYLVTGYLALLGYAAVHADSGRTLVGASGAISGVLGAFLHLFPRARVTSLFPFLFFLPLRFPAWAVLLFWFVLQWLATGTDAGRPGVAYLAHVLGFCLGFGYAWVTRTRAATVSSRGTPPGPPAGTGDKPT